MWASPVELSNIPVLGLAARVPYNSFGYTLGISICKISSGDSNKQSILRTAVIPRWKQERREGRKEGGKEGRKERKKEGWGDDQINR